MSTRAQQPLPALTGAPQGYGKDSHTLDALKSKQSMARSNSKDLVSTGIVSSGKTDVIPKPVLQLVPASDSVISTDTGTDVDEDDHSESLPDKLSGSKTRTSSSPVLVTVESSHKRDKQPVLIPVVRDSPSLSVQAKLKTDAVLLAKMMSHQSGGITYTSGKSELTVNRRSLKKTFAEPPKISPVKVSVPSDFMSMIDSGALPTTAC